MLTAGRFLGNADKPTLNLLKEHAVNYSQDTDNGATRFSEHYKKVNGIDCATSPAQQLRPPRFLAAEEEAHPFVSLALSPLAWTLSATSCVQQDLFSPCLSTPLFCAFGAHRDNCLNCTDELNCGVAEQIGDM